jgi:hypothetical protein
MSRRPLALFAAVMLLLAACGDTDADSASTDDSGGFEEVDGVITADPTSAIAGDDAPDDRTDDSDTSGADGEADGFGSGAPTAEVLAQDEPAEPTEPGERPQAEVVPIFLGRQIIKTGDIVVEAADVRATTDAIIDTVFDNGGAIWGQETSTEPTPRAVLMIRVPPLDFDRLIAAITRVPGVGIVSENTTSDDVTEVVVDLDARITAAESSVARVQALLDDARDLNTIFQLEEELSTRQADLERLLGQRKTIGDQIALSTITLTVLELDPDRLQPEVEVVAWLGTSAEDACPGRSSLSMGAEDTAVLCISVNNTGEDTLTAIDVASPTLRLRVDDFEILDGVASLDEIKPGDELLLTVELDAEGGSVNRVDVSGGTDIAVEVSATPALSEGLELTATDSVFLSAEGDDPLPGFGDSFSSGWDAMIAVVSILMIVVGALLPFVPIIALAVWLGRKYVISQRRRADEQAAYVEAYVAAQAAPGPPDERGASK